MALPIFLCDDDSVLVQYYKSVIENWIMINDYDMELIFATTDPDDIFLYLKRNSITNCLFFLDIDLGMSLDGIDIAQQIRSDNEFAQIVFITSHQELAIKTLQRQISPLNYIVKDGQTEKKQIQKVLNSCHQETFIDRLPNQRHLSFLMGSRSIRVAISAIYFIETSPTPHKLILYGKDIMYEFYGKMDDLTDEYPELLRVHKSFLINPEQVKSIDYKSRTITFPEEYSCHFPLVKIRLLKKLFHN